MAVRYLLDTNIVSFHIRRSSPSLVRRQRRVAAASVALSVVTEMEIRFGLARNPGLRIARLVEAFLQGMTILPSIRRSPPRMRRSARTWSTVGARSDPST